MTARPPPARPHLAVHASDFGRTPTDWAEDDAWDSGSDDGDRRQPAASDVWPRAESSAPKPVPMRTTMSDKSSSSSTLAFSYTHVSAPNPSSYSPRNEQQPARNGWTIVRTSGEGARGEADEANPPPELYEQRGDDVEVEGDMILGEMDPDPTSGEGEEHTQHSRIPHEKTGKAAIRDDAEAIAQDPLRGVKYRARRPERSHTSHTRDPALTNLEHSEKLMRERSIKSNRRHKFVDCLSAEDVNIAELRKIAWAGIPSDLRPMAWQLLLGYSPLPTPLRTSTLQRKRQEYLSLVEVAFARDRQGLDQQIWHQIEIDVPRTRPGVRLWMHAATQRSLERILYVWAIRHPASGYVQGINDLATPFFQVFLSAYIDADPESFDPALLPPSVLNAVEADTFWCLSRLLDGIQDNYIFAQPGIQRSVRRMEELVKRIDAPLAAHLASQNVEFMQFAFRWMNCLLMREISVRNTIRMWDTYLSEGPDAFSQFHLYVCSAFLVKWSEKLQQMDFQGIIMFLQSLPTQGWGDGEIEMLLSEAFVLNSIWQNAQSHFN
ncbi:rab-GTPase-TBC domain-containing protein [Schizophyllum amplum]|uniref:Rab-GTPase-TBC domain-containing protein n=1 Tax=Schizophyllum amplum TaxID=97359 RepID=A0A550CXG4_9AGAR|nr:rab-GTPase-TBC domain-containing protein [Auriculariopsis ampla]